MKEIRADQPAKSRQQLAAMKSKKVSKSSSKPAQPLETSDHSSFIYFSKLPSEIRLEIWKFALASPFKWRIIYEAPSGYGIHKWCSRSANVIQKDEKKVSRLEIIPNEDIQLDDIFRISFVCHESRYEALRMASLCPSPDKFITHCPSLLEYLVLPRKAKVLPAIGKVGIPFVRRIILTGNHDALYYGWKMLIADALFPKLSGLQTLDLALERRGRPTKWTLGHPERRNTPQDMVTLSNICRRDYAKVHSKKLLHVEIWLPRPC